MKKDIFQNYFIKTIYFNIFVYIPNHNPNPKFSYLDDKI